MAEATSLRPDRRRVVVGVLAALGAVSIWAAWIVGTRFATTETSLPLGWILIFRYTIPGLILLPFWLRVGPLPKGVPLRILAVLVLGSGAPFLIVVATGMSITPAGEAGVLLPGTLGIFAAILARIVFGERLGPVRVFGYVLAGSGALMIGLPAFLAAGLEGIGRLLLPVGAFLWASYTLAFRSSGLPVLAATGIVCFWSTLIALPLVVLEGIEPILAETPGVLFGQFVVQSVLSGLLALICYGAAISRLGASQAAAFAALAPALAAVLGVPVLGEVPGPVVIAGILVTMAGVALSSGAFGRRRRPAPEAWRQPAA